MMGYRSPGTSCTPKDALDGNRHQEAAAAFLSRLREWPVVDEAFLDLDHPMPGLSGFDERLAEEIRRVVEG